MMVLHSKTLWILGALCACLLAVVLHGDKYLLFGDLRILQCSRQRESLRTDYGIAGTQYQFRDNQASGVPESEEVEHQDEQSPSHAATVTAFSHHDYTIGWICALPLEMTAAKAMLDVIHPALPNPPNDYNTYTFGKMGVHNVVVACMPSGVYGMTSATTVASQMLSTFPSIRFGSMVGIGGGAPHQYADIRLGDVVVSKPTENFGGVVQYDLGKTVQEGGFKRTGTLNKPPQVLLTAVSGLQADHSMRSSRIQQYLSEMAAKHPSLVSEFAYPSQQPDRLFEAEYEHIEFEKTCDKCVASRLVNRPRRTGNSPVIHYGLIASANQVMKHAGTRDRLARELGILCFEMEAGGLMDNFPSLIIRGICDYADSHKNKQWQKYAAATAAAYGKELLSVIPANQERAATRATALMKDFVAEWRSAAQISETRPLPSTIIPFRRDPDFVERPVLDEILQRASEPGGRIGLVGLGGVGKSQLAIEYAYRVQDADPHTWVFWVHASSAARFEESYRKVATHLRLPGWNEPKADVLCMVHGWLSDESNGRWAMVVDNADDADVMFESWNGGTNTSTIATSANRSLSEFLPLSSSGSIVVTSRSKQLVKRLQVFDEDILDVGPMEVDVAEDLLLEKLKKGGPVANPNDMVRLVNQLDCMPLAISQAAAYIEQCAPRITVSKYMEIIKKDDKELATLLQKDVPDPRRDRQASNSIIKTWHVTFTHLRQTRDSAARLLALMSLFDREAIPDYLLRGRYMEARDGKIDFEDDIATLRDYSLIGIGVSDHVFDMHRLVQLSTQKLLEIHAELQEWQERYVHILGTAFPTGDYTNWITCQTLFPHVQAMYMYQVMSAENHQTWAEVLYNGAWYASASGQYGIAERMSRASLEIHQKILGLDGPATLASIVMLATVLDYRGKYSEAEEIHRRALAGHEKVLGVDHPSTLTSMNNLAEVLRNQGKHVEAEVIHRRALAGREKVLGVGYSSTLTSMNNLAVVLGNQGKYSQAEEMHRRALAGLEKLLGVDHPSTLTSVNNLAEVLRNQGKYTETEEMHRHALAGREKVLGVDHPSTLTSVNNLALVLGAQRKYSEAEEMSRRALAGYEKVLGVDHPSTLTSVNNLALVLGIQGKYSQAEEMYRRALAGLKKALEVDHPSTLTSMSNLAGVLRDQGKYFEAEEIYRRALVRREKILGVDHLDTLTSVNNLAEVLRSQGKYTEAEEIHREALAGREKVLGVDHPSTLTSVSNLALVLGAQRKYSEAEEMNRRALAGHEKTLGIDHPSTLTSVYNLALVLGNQGKYSQAEEIYRQALAGLEKALEVDHPSTLTSVSNLARVLQDQGKHFEAEEMHRRALAGREKVLGTDHPDTLTSVYWLAFLFDAMEDHDEALNLYERAIVGYNKVLGPEHPTTMACERHRASLVEKMS